MSYRGRIAPSITGYLHTGHLRTFLYAQKRAIEHNGILLYRAEDLDRQRYRPEYENSAIDDLSAFSISWQEGPYRQSDRMSYYKKYLRKLIEKKLIYPCNRTRKEIQELSPARHGELVFASELRPGQFSLTDDLYSVNWRFLVPDREQIQFVDTRMGTIVYQTGYDFSDFLVWRKDGFPSYELAVVVDDIHMRITEVVRGTDLLLSTARQLLLYNAFGFQPPAFYHTELKLDLNGRKLSKRDSSTTLRDLLASGLSVDEVVALSQLNE